MSQNSVQSELFSEAGETPELRRRRLNTDKHARWRKTKGSTPEAKEKANALARKSYAIRRPKETYAKAGRPRPSNCEQCGRTWKIAFDHCHASGKFRGWLCSHCNLILGHAGDDPHLLRRLADYLEKNK
jgi:hypothetical protein